MLSPHGEAAPHDGPERPSALGGGVTDEPFDIPVDALVDRLRRRTAAVERQLDARIEEVGTLRARIADHDNVLAAAREGEARAWREVERLTAEHEALMSTLTMRILRRPRDWYGAARRRLGRR